MSSAAGAEPENGHYIDAIWDLERQANGTHILHGIIAQ